MLGGAEPQAVLAHRVRFLDDTRRMQQGLRRYAAHIETHAAQRRRSLDQRDAQSQISGAECRRVASRAGTQHYNIKGVVRGARRRCRRFLLRGLRLPAAWMARRASCGARRLRARLIRQGDRLDIGLLTIADRFRRRHHRRLFDLFGAHRRNQGALRYAVTLLHVHAFDHARDHCWHVHGRLVGLEGDQRVVDADTLSHRRQDIDDRDVLEVTEVGDTQLNEIHGIASRRPRGSASTRARNVVKRTASAPSTTR